MTAEEWTIGELRPLLDRGWRLVNGVRLRSNMDIDHIAIGPPGVMVLETKWSSEPWPLGVTSGSFMVHRLDDAVEQARRNARDVAHNFNRELVGVPVIAAVVLWSATPTAADNAWVEKDGVFVLGGQALRPWLNTLDKQVLGADDVHRVWAALEKHAARRDTHDVEVQGPPRPTLTRLFWRWIFQPFLGFGAGAYVVSLISFVEGWRAEAAVVVTCAVVGIAALRVPSLRRAALGWLLASSLFVAILVVDYAARVVSG